MVSIENLAHGDGPRWDDGKSLADSAEVAWTGIFVRWATESPGSEAVAKTFDGNRRSLQRKLAESAPARDRKKVRP